MYIYNTTRWKRKAENRNVPEKYDLRNCLNFLFYIEHCVLMNFPFADVGEIGSRVLYNGFVT